MDQWVAAAAAFGAGVVNTIAGGGTNLTFPTLLWLGVPPVQASATSTVALWPGQVVGAWAYHREIGRVSRVWLWLAVPSLLGGLLGGWLLVQTPDSLFRVLVPYLVLSATVLLAVEPALRRWLALPEHHRFSPALAGAVQFVIAIYGGYFGAGMGIMMLASLSFLGVGTLHEVNGLKNLFGALLNLAAVGYFLLVGAVAWAAAGPMVLGAVLGSWAGAWLGRRIPEKPLRMLMVALGVAVGVVLLAG